MYLAEGAAANTVQVADNVLNNLYYIKNLTGPVTSCSSEARMVHMEPNCMRATPAAQTSRYLL